jgi:hypothetical protein
VTVFAWLPSGGVEQHAVKLFLPSIELLRLRDAYPLAAQLVTAECVQAVVKAIAGACRAPTKDYDDGAL